MPPLLEVDNLRACLRTPRGVSRPVDGVSFSIEPGETLALVGESGCGKSMTALSMLQLLPEPAGYIESGRVLFEGVDLLDYSWEEMRPVRGGSIGMVFQEPMTSLNPTFTVGWQIAEAVRLHRRVSAAAARRLAAEALERVHLPEPRRVMRQYPHELSGGMRQRAMIAMALVNGPRLLIADEPTTALDVTIQAQILELLAQLQQESRMAVLLITHDLGIVRQVADRVAVMYAGQLVETGPAADVFRTPRHPYTQGLLASRPSRSRRGTDLAVLDGRVPDAAAWPSGCRFAARCPRRMDVCSAEPAFARPAAGVSVRCHLYGADHPAGIPVPTAAREAGR